MEQTKQQTAVDSLWDSLTCLFFFQDGIPVEAMDAYQQAKQKEKEQIINARVDGIWEISKCTMNPTYTFSTSEQYYNETYNTQQQ